MCLVALTGVLEGLLRRRQRLVGPVSIVALAGASVFLFAAGDDGGVVLAAINTSSSLAAVLSVAVMGRLAGRLGPARAASLCNAAFNLAIVAGGWLGRAVYPLLGTTWASLVSFALSFMVTAVGLLLCISEGEGDGRIGPPPHAAAPASYSDVYNEISLDLASRYGLTSREAEVCRGLCRGKRLQTIADEAGISVNTVKTHVSHIYQKAGVSSREELIALASEEPRPARH